MKQRQKIYARKSGERLAATAILLCLLITVLSFPIQAANNSMKIAGKVYTFPDDNDYEISSSQDWKKTDSGAKTYGTFSITGQLGKQETHNGVPSFHVRDGLPEFSYTYGDTLLKAQNPDLQLYSDSSNKLDGKKLESDIKNGVLILQTSIDQKNWVDVFTQTNCFEEVPVQKEAFYTAQDIEVLNGCYYRVLIAYETKILTKSTDLLVMDWNSYEYTKHAEVYDFYLYCDETNQKPQSPIKYTMGDWSRTEEFDGYWKQTQIDNNDPHYGWNLGEFFISGSPINEGAEKPVFLKKNGDLLELWFHLNQNIDALNGNPALSIASDEQGYDRELQTPLTRLGRGALFIEYTDHENKTHEAQIYTDYLAANTSAGADTKVRLFEEGDYKVALDYEILNDRWIDKRSHYRIAFEFSVRNSNCMAFLFDVSDNRELFNNDTTENGFRIDLGNSHHLDIFVKREVLTQGAEGITEDIRFNHVARDGQKYTQDGIYTITVKNRYTNQETEKRVYVGTDPIMKAHMQTGKSIPALKNLVADGAMIDEMGNIIMPDVETTVETVPSTVPATIPTTIPATIPETTVMTAATEASEAEVPAAAEIDRTEKASSPVAWIIVSVAVLGGAGVATIAKRRNKK